MAEQERAIVLVHGAGAKPDQEALQEYWRRAMLIGLERDAPKRANSLRAVPVEMIYYAHKVPHREQNFDAVLDKAQREQVLDKLASYSSAKDFRRRYYEGLPGKTPLKEFVMDTAATLGVGGVALAKMLPELAAYWQDDSGWATEVRRELEAVLTAHLEAGRNVLLVTHCVGSVMAFDTLWGMPPGGHRIALWLTLGSPLGSQAVISRLLGAQAAGVDRYPQNIMRWHNVAAEDDYVCHDKSVRDDFHVMLDKRIVGEIDDHIIYNLAVRYGRSNPHHSAGYLAHPRVSSLIQEWLADR